MGEHDELTADELALGNTLGASFAELSLTTAQRQRHLERFQPFGAAHRTTVSINPNGSRRIRRMQDLMNALPVRTRPSRHRPRFSRALEGAAVVLIVVIFAAGALLARALMSGQGSSSSSPASAPKVSTVYAFQQLSTGAKLLPLDPITLADQSGGPLAPPAGYWAVSPDGSTVVTFAYQQGTGEIVVRDGFTGKERNRFASPVPGIVGTIELSHDASRLLVNRRLQPSQWYVIDTRSGKLMMTIETESRRFGFDTPMHADDFHLSPDGTRLYRFVFSDHADASGPQPLRIIEYDVATGKQQATMAYDSILVGSWQSTVPDAPGPVSNFLGPGIAFSPNGQEIALIQPDGSAVVLLDARKLTVERTIPLSRPAGFLERNLRRLGLAPQRAAAKTMGGALHSAVFAPDGTTLYTWGDTISVDSTSGMQGLGITRVDLTNGTARQVLVGTLIQQVQPSPDGSSLYVTGYIPTASTTSPPQFVRRLDPTSLQTLAERTWPDVYSFELVTQP